MTRFFHRYTRPDASERMVLNRFPAYVLGRIKGEALALHACRPENSWLRDQACVVIGYAEAFAYYGEDEFPWGHVAERLRRMRTIITQAERLSRKINEGHADVRQAA